MLQLVEREVTNHQRAAAEERELINPGHLQIEASNPRYLEAAWNRGSVFGIPLVSELPPLVSCATLSMEVPTTVGQILSPTSYENALPVARRARTGGIESGSGTL